MIAFEQAVHIDARQMNVIRVKRPGRYDFFNFNDTFATTIPFLNEGYEHNLRPPAVYKASEGNIYTFATPYSMGGGARLTRYNMATGATSSVDIAKADVDAIVGSGLGTGALIAIIAGAIVVLLLLVVVLFCACKKKKKGVTTSGA